MFLPGVPVGIPNATGVGGKLQFRKPSKYYSAVPLFYRPSIVAYERALWIKFLKLKTWGTVLSASQRRVPQRDCVRYDVGFGQTFLNTAVWKVGTAVRELEVR